MPADDLWIESHVGMSRHPKTKRLRHVLDEHRPDDGHDALAATVGHMHMLWHATMEQEPEGDLSGYVDDEIAELAGWKGDPAVFVDAIRAVGFLDPDGQLHNWWEYAEKWLARRKVNRERQNLWREQQKLKRLWPATPDGDVALADASSADHRDSDVASDVTCHVTRHVTGTSPSRNGATKPDHTGPDLTKPNQTEEGGPTPAPDAPAEVVDVPAPPPVAPPPSRRDLVRMDEVLRPLSKRGFAANHDFWAKVNERYPFLDLELEAIKIVDWLEQPRHARERCTKVRILNWLDKAEEDRKRREADAQAIRAGQATAPMSGYGHGTDGTNGVIRPQAPNRNPEADLPEWDEAKAKASEDDKQRAREALAAKKIVGTRPPASVAPSWQRPKPETKSA